MSNYKSNHKKKFLAQKGQVAVIIALLMVCLIGMAALVIDLGSMYQKRASFQTVADSAALAGAQEFTGNSDYKDGAIQAAIDYAYKNNVVIDSNDVEISKTLSPYLSPYYDIIKVTFSDPAPVYFAGVLGINTVDVGASATAMVGGPKQVYNVVPWAVIVPVGTINWWDVGALVPGEEKVIAAFSATGVTKGNFCAWNEVIGTLPSDWNTVIYPNRIKYGYSSPLSVNGTIYVREIDMAITVPPTTTRVTQGGGVWDPFEGSFDALTLYEGGLYKLAKTDTQFVIVPVIYKPKFAGDPAIIKAFAPFILVRIDGDGTPSKPYNIIGKFIHQALIVNEGDVEAVTSVGLRVIRLIR